MINAILNCSLRLLTSYSLNHTSTTKDHGGHFKPDADQRMAFQKKYHMFPKSAYNAAGNDDDGRWEALECGTAMCVAGWAASLNKYYPSCSIINVVENGESIKRPKFDWGMVSKNKYLFRRRRTECRDVSEVGAELLGISEQEADILFHGDMEWDANDLREFCLLYTSDAADE